MRGPYPLRRSGTRFRGHVARCGSVGKPVEAVDVEHDIGGLGGGGGTADAERDADVGRGERAGASFTPSPTMIVGPMCRSNRTASTFSDGVRSANTSSTPVTAPTISAISERSPVTKTARLMPARRKFRSVRARVGTHGVVEEDADGDPVDADEHSGRSIELGPTPESRAPSPWAGPRRPTTAGRPSPRGRGRCRGSRRPLPRAPRWGAPRLDHPRTACTMAEASTWGDTWSSEPAARSRPSRSHAAPGAITTSAAREPRV